MAKIITLAEYLRWGSSELMIDQIKNIFYEASSVKNFKSEDHKLQFFNKWCGDYIKYYPETFYLMIDTDKRLLGYLSGCDDTLASEKVLKVPGVEIFNDLYGEYQAHLHINFRSDTRGRGLGSLIVDHYATELRERDVNGLHLITSKNARNVSFYQKLGFVHTCEREFNSSELYFMGKKIE